MSAARWLAVAVTLLLAACSSAPKRHEPAPLPPDARALAVQPAWSVRLAPVQFALAPRAVGDMLAAAASDGTVAVLDARSGAAVWRASVKAELSAGVGFDGRWLAVVTRENELVVLEAGRELWRQRLTAQVFTAPLVAGQRVFVLGGDRSVAAYDGQSGRRLWTQQRSGDPLTLRQAGVLLAVGDTLVAGQSGKLTGLDPLTGATRWEAPLATPRGTNDIERLVDLVAPVARVRDVVCARAFQAAVGCVDASRGALGWSKPAAGLVGLGMNDTLVYGAESDGLLLAWRLRNGERAWSSEALRYRELSAPLVTPRALVLGDAGGLLHFVSPQDGSLLTRVPTDGSALSGAPLLVGGLVLAVTRGGSVMAWRLPE